MPESADIAQSEAVIVAGIIARTSADFAGRTESTISEALLKQFAAADLELSEGEAQRIAHDIALAPKNRRELDD